MAFIRAHLDKAVGLVGGDVPDPTKILPFIRSLVDIQKIF